MDGSYNELLVQQVDKTPQIMVIIMFIVIGVSVACGIFVHPLFFLGVVVGGLLAYFLGFSRMTTEYEYAFMDKELRIDRIYNRARRKKIEILDLNKMEILAKEGSDKLKSMEHRQCKVTNYSSNSENTEELKNYVMYYDGVRRIEFTFNDEMIKCIRRLSPMKVEEF